MRDRARPRARDLVMPPFPKRQMFVLALCRICEPIAFMSIFPYIYYMIQDFNITQNKSEISFYAGMVTSAFTFAEFSTGVIWGRLSDTIGRKPVLLMGLAGTGLSVVLFGFSQNFPMALFARALGGLLNGNIGVLQTTVAEIVTVKDHQPRAYTIMPMVWCLGSFIGPMIGGVLAKPVANYPSIFGSGSIWDDYPYLLPNLFSALCVFFGLVIGILFLEETHAERKHRTDNGVELGKKIMARMPWSRKNVSFLCVDECVNARLLLEDADEGLPGYRTAENLTVLPLRRQAPNPKHLVLDEFVKDPSRFGDRIFTRPVILNIVSYGILAFHTMTFDSLFPVLLSTNPAEQRTPVSLPFKFPAGYALDTQRIGIILSIQGVYSIFSTCLLVPFVTRKLGPLQTFRIVAASYFILYWITPYMALLPESLGSAGVYVIIVWKCTFSSMAYPSNAILLSNSAPTTLSLGTINGVAASTASLCRTFGPTLSGLLYALGLQTGYSGLVWWMTGFVAITGAFIGLQIPEPRDRLEEKVDDEGLIEAHEVGRDD